MKRWQQVRRGRTPGFAGVAFLGICILWMLCATPGIAVDYYVSGSGDDGNSGTSPAAAWRSMAKVNGFQFAPGDVVHFECGGEWRGQLVPSSGSPQGPVTYTSYGDGPKPLLLGSVEKSEPGDWRPVGTNLWRTGPFPVDVGNIIFNNGQTCAVKVWTEAEVKGPQRFWFDRQQRTVLLCAEQNPAMLFDDIECALKNHIINEGGKSYVVYDGLHLAYGAAHGIGGGGTHHIVVRNCDLCFIGGGHQHSRKTPHGVRHVRYGNGIEFWSSAHDNLVEGCRVWDIYDAGLTNQGSGNNTQYNITYRNNVVWNCEYSFEYWNRPAESTTHDIYFEDNFCYNAGRGWSHAQRPWPAGVHLMFFSNSARTDRFFVRRNVFHGVEHSAMNVDAARWNGLDGLVLSDNTYCQPPDTVLARWGERSFTAAAFADYQQATQKDRDSHLVVLESLNLEPATVRLRIGVTRQLSAVAGYSSGKTVDVTPLVRFASSDVSVATVTRWGLVRAEGPGKAEVSATINGSAATAAVVVEPQERLLDRRADEHAAEHVAARAPDHAGGLPGGASPRVAKFDNEVGAVAQSAQRGHFRVEERGRVYEDQPIATSQGVEQAHEVHVACRRAVGGGESPAGEHAEPRKPRLSDGVGPGDITPQHVDQPMIGPYPKLARQSRISEIGVDGHDFLGQFVGKRNGERGDRRRLAFTVAAAGEQQRRGPGRRQLGEDIVGEARIRPLVRSGERTRPSGDAPVRLLGPRHATDLLRRDRPGDRTLGLLGENGRLARLSRLPRAERLCFPR